MNNHEEDARRLKESGKLCSDALYEAFSKDYKLNGDFPAPRSIDGKCGALLTALFILRETGHEDKCEEFEKWFVEQFGYAKCIDLMSHERRCSDYVGESAKWLDEVLGE